jgi:AraC-like DNA-binding protein
MLIVSYLPPLLLPRLVDAMRDVEVDHRQALTWDEVEATVRHYPRCILVLDPHTDRTDRSRDIAALIQQVPSAPVILYTEFTPAALRALTFLAPYRVHDTVLFQIDDTRARLMRLLVRAATHPLVVRMLEELQPKCRLLPPLLATAIDDLFRRPHAYASGRDLSLTSHTPHTSLKRALTAAGLAPPKHLFVAARVLHAVGYLRDLECTVEQVAEKAGYLHPRVLTQHTLAVFGVRPSTIRNFTDDEILATLAAWTRLTPSTQQDLSDFSQDFPTT